MMEDLGLNPDDDQENYNTPVGIGNLCGNNVVRDRLDDGVNQVNIRLWLQLRSELGLVLLYIQASTLFPLGRDVFFYKCDKA